MMRTTSWVGMVGAFAFAVLIAGCAEYAAGPKGSTGSMNGSTSAAPATGIDQMAVESQTDTLSACLDRIPSNATAGQRMLAERTCQDAAKRREPIERVPGP